MLSAACSMSLMTAIFSDSISSYSYCNCSLAAELSLKCSSFCFCNSNSSFSTFLVWFSSWFSSERTFRSNPSFTPFRLVYSLSTPFKPSSSLFYLSTMASSAWLLPASASSALCIEFTCLSFLSFASASLVSNTLSLTSALAPTTVFSSPVNASVFYGPTITFTTASWMPASSSSRFYSRLSTSYFRSMFPLRTFVFSRVIALEQMRCTSPAAFSSTRLHSTSDLSQFISASPSSISF